MMRDEAQLLIGDLAKLSGLTPEAIRYYERERVIPAARRVGTGQYRRYERADADRLRFVRRARELGSSLDDEREVVALAQSDPAKPCDNVEGIARAHIAAIEAKIAQLNALRTELARLTKDCDPAAGVGDCSLLAALK